MIPVKYIHSAVPQTYIISVKEEIVRIWQDEMHKAVATHDFERLQTATFFLKEALKIDTTQVQIPEAPVF